MHVLRGVVSQARVPPIFTEEQRQLFVENIDRLKLFLESPDGALSVELLVNAFACFIEEQDNVVAE